jgi:rubrerythrin
MAEPFNIDRFMDASNKLDLSDIDWAEVPKHPMTPEALRCLRYFLLTEGSTFFYTKALMKTKAAIEEPEFAPFLCVWMYEEEYHGRAFRQFLEAYGERVEPEYRREMFDRRGAGERIDELGQTVLSQVFPEAWPAVHMVWGVIQEFTTYHGYQALIERVNHPILTVICERIMKQELRHFAFYRAHAKKRLASSRVSRTVTTAALKLGWTPVGDGMCEKEEVFHAIRFLFDGRDGDVARRIENKVRELPGLEWFDMFTKYVNEHDIRRAPDTWFPNRRERTRHARAETVST